ncbi:hypothetical protein BGZ63DRAFT_458901 [Mariannaea sp. PMI_226]|nr:hypothetical protein BGZ63DRAFT_458901 [Mariannaea sp. PMI_226]
MADQNEIGRYGLEPHRYVPVESSSAAESSDSPPEPVTFPSIQVNIGAIYFVQQEQPVDGRPVQNAYDMEPRQPNSDESSSAQDSSQHSGEPEQPVEDTSERPDTFQQFLDRLGRALDGFRDDKDSHKEELYALKEENKALKKRVEDLEGHINDVQQTTEKSISQLSKAMKDKFFEEDESLDQLDQEIDYLYQAIKKRKRGD